MPKRLILMRHAKSSWSSDADNDHARPLNNRGRRDAPRIAHHLCARAWTPQLVLSSDATRTRETWALMEPVFHEHDITPSVHYTRALYHAGYKQVRQEAAALADRLASVETILVLGHNPGWEKMLYKLCGQSHRVTTANAALLSHSGDAWDDALSDRAEWRFHAILRPKELD